MKIKLLVSRATATGAEDRGHEIDVPDKEAIRLIEAGQAEAVREAPKAEKAVPRRTYEKAAK